MFSALTKQVGHGVLGLYVKLQRSDPALVSCWEQNAQPKIVLKVEDEEEL